jgi:PAS domain S-box-containing protein
LMNEERRITTPGPGTGSGDNGKKRTTQEFAESHDRRIDPLESLMDAMPSPVFLKDRNGFYIGCNRAFERHAGMSRDEIIGKTVYDVWPRELAEAYSKSDDELLEVPGYRTFEARIDYADGSPRDVVINKATFTDDTGTVAGIVGVMVDVTERKAAERSALEAEKKYRELTEALPQVIFETDVTGTISYVNQAGYDLFGYTEDDIAAGISALNVIDPVDHERVAGAIAKMMDGRSVGALREYLARRKDGSTFPCLVDSTLVADELGEPAGIRGILTDITERRKAEDAMRESEEKHRALFDSSLDGIVFVDTEGRIVDANAAYLDMLGYTREEIREFSYQELTPASWHRVDEEMVETQISRRGFSDEYEKEYIRKDGSVFPISLRAWLLKDDRGESVGMWGIIRDITERKRREEELRRINVELDCFAHTVSHDLKGPLSAIKAAGDTLVFLLDTKQTDEVRSSEMQVAKIIGDGARRSAALIDDMLSLAEAGQEPEEVREVDVSDVVTRVLRERREAIVERGIRVADFNGLGTLVANPTHVYQMFTNLIGNAIQHNDSANPEIAVSYLGRDRRGSHRYLVRDNGSGIPSEDLDRVFVPFFKGKPTGETGLGLSTVEKIAKVYGGSIRAYNEGGACFELVLNDYRID